MIANSFESLDGWSWCEVPGPEGMRIARIGEEIIRLSRPGDVSIMERLQVARRCRIEDVDLGAIHLTFIGVPDDVLNS